MASGKRSIFLTRTGTASQLYWDRPEEQWPRDADGALAMTAAPLDLAELIRA